MTPVFSRDRYFHLGKGARDDGNLIDGNIVDLSPHNSDEAGIDVGQDSLTAATSPSVSTLTLCCQRLNSRVKKNSFRAYSAQSAESAVIEVKLAIKPASNQATIDAHDIPPSPSNQ